MGKARVLVAHENTSTALIEMSCEDIIAGDILVSWRNIPMPMMSEIPELDPFDAPRPERPAAASWPPETAWVRSARAT